MVPVSGEQTNRGKLVGAVMNGRVHWRIFCSVVAAAALLAFGLHAWLGLNFRAGLGLILGAILVNGILATIEDEMPGGFNNPKPDSRRHEPK
jgi:hypothetical protein